MILDLFTHYLVFHKFINVKPANLLLKIFTTVTVLCCCHLMMNAQKNHFVGARIYHENDILGFLASNKDDNYTGGLKAELITNLLDVPIGQVVNKLKWKPIQQSFSFSVTVFTPQVLASPVIVTDERPYASYRSWNFGSSFAHDDRLQRFSLEIMLGAMGRPVSGDVQTKFHREGRLGSTRPEPKGWGFEIADGGAFAANLKLAYVKKLSKASKRNGFQTTWLHEVNFGQYMTNYMQGRRLYYVRGNGNIVLDEGIPELLPINGKKEKKTGFYVFVTPRIKAVLHNNHHG
jgi:hypothetical protein